MRELRKLENENMKTIEGGGCNALGNGEEVRVQVPVEVDRWAYVYFEGGGG